MKTLLNRLSSMAMALLVALCVLLVVLRLFGVSVILVSGTSMEPNYKGGEIHLMAKADNYERGDVVCVCLDDMTILKRIIATEGNTVEIYHHTIRVNGKTIVPYITGENWNKTGEFDTCLTIGTGEVYLLGDSRNDSADSRHFGTTNAEQILGKVVW